MNIIDRIRELEHFEFRTNEIHINGINFTSLYGVFVYSTDCENIRIQLFSSNIVHTFILGELSLEDLVSLYNLLGSKGKFGPEFIV